MEGDESRLHREHQEQEQSTRAQERPVGGIHLSGPDRQIGHVERTGHGVDQADRDQEQGGSHEIHADILEPGREPARAAAMKHQPIGGDQHDFEPDEQVEDVAGQERAVDPHQLELEERMKMMPLFVPAVGRIDRHGHGERGGQQHHRGGKPIENQHDAEGSGPVPHQIRAHEAVGGEHVKRHAHAEQQRRGDQRNTALEARRAPQSEHKEGRGERREQERSDDPAAHGRMRPLSSSTLA
jgi:hypothetical protein